VVQAQLESPVLAPPPRRRCENCFQILRAEPMVLMGFYAGDQV
jgi:hypothetical protein